MKLTTTIGTLVVLVLAGFSFTNSAHAQETVSINIMQHICDASIQSVATFDAVDGPDANTTTEFHDKVLLCPTVIMPADNYSNGVHFDGKRSFNYAITDKSGNVQNISDAVFQQRQVCESNATADPNNGATTFLPAGMDVNGDGLETACLDTSLYSFSGIADGFVTVTQTGAPGATRAGALEFTPDALNPNNDDQTLLAESVNSVFNSDSVVLLDTTRDDNNSITLHIYNFVGQRNTPAVPAPATPVVPGLPTTGGGDPTTNFIIFGLSGLLTILGLGLVYTPVTKTQ